MIGKRWRSKLHERKCPCDDGPAELGEEREPCPIHDGVDEDLDVWGNRRTVNW